VERTRVTRLTTEEVIRWFREHRDVLRQYPDCKTVLLRNGAADASREVLSQGMFDQRRNALRFWREIIADELDGDLLSLFGDKPLVEFQ
jgi:hypothetical protein